MDVPGQTCCRIAERQRPEVASQSREVTLEHGPFPGRPQIARPQTQDRVIDATRLQALGDCACGPPEPLDPPPTRETLGLDTVGRGTDECDVDDVAQAAQRLVRPRVGGEQQHVVFWREHEDPLRPFAARTRSRAEFFHGRRRPPVEPLRCRVDLDSEQQPGWLQWAKVVDVEVEAGVADGLEPCCEQRTLGACRVVDEQVDVPVATQRRIGIEGSHLGALDDHRGAIVRRRHTLEHKRRRDRCDRRRALLLQEILGHSPAGRPPAAGSEHLETMAAEIAVACPVDERLEARPRASVPEPVAATGQVCRSPLRRNPAPATTRTASSPRPTGISTLVWLRARTPP